MSQRRPKRRPEKSARDQDSEDATEREIDRDALTERGPIKCGSVERRRLLEAVGREDAVEWIGDAAAAGRQAERDDDWESDLHE